MYLETEKASVVKKRFKKFKPKIFSRIEMWKSAAANDSVLHELAHHTSFKSVHNRFRSIKTCAAKKVPGFNKAGIKFPTPLSLSFHGSRPIMTSVSLVFSGSLTC